MAGPVYSAVGLPRSRGKRGCVQGLINHGCFGRDKQAGPSRDAAAPATGLGGGGVHSMWGNTGKARTGWGRAEETADSHSGGIRHNTCSLVPHLRGCTGL